MLDITIGEARNWAEIELMEGGAEILTLSQDRTQAQPRLEIFQACLFEETVVVIDREVPSGIMVMEKPGAAAHQRHRGLPFGPDIV